MSLNDKAFGQQNPATLRPSFRRAKVSDVKPGELYWTAPFHEVECDPDGFSLDVRLLSLAEFATVCLCDFAVDKAIAEQNGANASELAYFDREVTILSFVPAAYVNKENLQ